MIKTKCKIISIILFALLFSNLSTICGQNYVIKTCPGAFLFVQRSIGIEKLVSQKISIGIVTTPVWTTKKTDGPFPSFDVGQAIGIQLRHYGYSDKRFQGFYTGVQLGYRWPTATKTSSQYIQSIFGSLMVGIQYIYSSGIVLDISGGLNLGSKREGRFTSKEVLVANGFFHIAVGYAFGGK